MGVTSPAQPPSFSKHTPVTEEAKNPYPVTAPSDALDTSLAYLAITPVL